MLLKGSLLDTQTIRVSNCFDHSLWKWEDMNCIDCTFEYCNGGIVWIANALINVYVY